MTVHGVNRQQSTVNIIPVLPEMISYIELAIALGTNRELRQQNSNLIEQRMQSNPKFLDSRTYSAQMGTLFQELFRSQQATVLTDNQGKRILSITRGFSTAD